VGSDPAFCAPVCAEDTAVVRSSFQKPRAGERLALRSAASPARRLSVVGAPGRGGFGIRWRVEGISRV